MEEENANNGAGGAGVTPLAGQGDQPESPGLERRPAADGPLRPRDVTSYDGSYIEAVSEGLYELPPPMMWNMWQTYRRIWQSVPTVAADGEGHHHSSSAESELYGRVMLHYYGEGFKRKALAYQAAHPTWLRDLELGDASAAPTPSQQEREGSAAAPASLQPPA